MSISMAEGLARLKRAIRDGGEPPPAPAPYVRPEVRPAPEPVTYTAREQLLHEEVQQLRLLRTPAGNRQMAQDLAAAREQLRLLEEIRLELQAANESLNGHWQRELAAERQRRARLQQRLDELDQADFEARRRAGR